jgi:hypothetical protein
MQKLEKRGLPGLDYENDISRRKAKESGFDEVRQIKARFIQLKGEVVGIISNSDRGSNPRLIRSSEF